MRGPVLMRRSDSASSHEPITTKSTVLGILIPPALMITLKLLVLGLSIATIIIIGRISGPAFVIAAAWHWKTRPYDRENREKVSLAFWLGCFLVFVEYVLQAWPRPIMWIQFPDGMWISFLGEPFLRAEPWMMITRVAIGFVMMWLLDKPYEWSMWTLMMELIVPKWRESTFTRGDIGSVPQPEGFDIKGHQLRQVMRDQTAHIPARGNRGPGPEMVGE